MRLVIYPRISLEFVLVIFGFKSLLSNNITKQNSITSFEFDPESRWPTSLSPDWRMGSSRFHDYIIFLRDGYILFWKPKKTRKPDEYYPNPNKTRHLTPKPEWVTPEPDPNPTRTRLLTPEHITTGAAERAFFWWSTKNFPFDTSKMLKISL